MSGSDLSEHCLHCSVILDQLLVSLLLPLFREARSLRRVCGKRRPRLENPGAPLLGGRMAWGKKHRAPLERCSVMARRSSAGLFGGGEKKKSDIARCWWTWSWDCRQAGAWAAQPSSFPTLWESLASFILDGKLRGVPQEEHMWASECGGVSVCTWEGRERWPKIELKCLLQALLTALPCKDRTGGQRTVTPSFTTLSERFTGL